MTGGRRTGTAVRAALGTLVGLAAAAVLPLAPAAPARALAPAQDHASAPAPSRTPLRHVVIMTQQGHTFDNYLGSRPGTGGLPEVCLPGATASSPCVAPHPISGSPHAALPATAAGQRTSVAGGRMNGFVRAQALHGSSGRVAMGYYATKRLPILNGLADRGVVFDRWFAAVPGGSVANDLFAVAATAPGAVSAVPAKGWGDTPLIFDRLRAGGVSWKVYVENYEADSTIRTAKGSDQHVQGQVARVPLLAENRWLGASLRGHVVPLSSYYQDLARDALPQVALVVTTQHTEKPPQDPISGQAVVRGVANALLGSSAQRDSVFFLTYADPGGWYDHVAPIAAPGGAGRGLRVPTVAISPYLRAGTVDHTTLDSAALLKLIEQNWALPPLTSRDRDAPNLLARFTFRAAPNRPALVGVTPTSAPPHVPDRLVLYVGYLGVLFLGAACVSAIVWRTRRVPRVGDSS
ncbi:MAG TPA: alkaline phosphatase family protein [Flexivirga sp.]|uniref:alkaline phosphatase family protein n=1 Tax=Flexivirga sp. TaxID=1962927 RepID=UPI002D13BF57|nr:alkaline phosphatase family protein [Flexivirga sp.]HWC24010.1 alkaline phosphatase family protein [Flexivirga sp.]